MTLMLGKLYDALRAADGIGEDKAREAAEEVAGYESRLATIESDLRLLKWMVGTTIVLTFGLLWLVLSMHQTIAAIAAKVGV